METRQTIGGAGMKISLETFLVEWKPGCWRPCRRSMRSLETFLVEWKPLGQGDLEGKNKP